MVRRDAAPHQLRLTLNIPFRVNHAGAPSALRREVQAVVALVALAELRMVVRVVMRNDDAETAEFTARCLDEVPVVVTALNGDTLREPFAIET